MKSVDLNDQSAPYLQIVEKYGAAHAAFRSTYVLRVPPPKKPSRWHYENLGTIAVLFIVTIAAVVVSGSRTVKEFGDVGGFAFIMLELGMINYAFIRTSRNYNKEHQKHLLAWVNAGIGLSFVVLIVANVDAVLGARFDLPAEVDLVIHLLVAISAPVLAFINGDVLGMYAVLNRFARQKALDDYNAQEAVWNEGFKSSWDREKARWGVRVDMSERQTDKQTALPVPNPVLSEQTQTQTDDRQTSRAGFGHNRTSDGQQKALDYFNAHPDEAGLPLRTLEGRIGVNKDTINAARKRWQSERETESQQAVNQALPENEYVGIASQNGTGVHE